MKARIAYKILNTDNYYLVLENPENGKLCYTPKTAKHTYLMMKACETLKDWTAFEEMNQGVMDAFEIDPEAE